MSIPQILATVVLIYLALVGGLYLFQRNLMYLPDTTRPRPETSGLGDMEEVTLRTADGLSLVAWYKPARTNKKPLLVYFHGNGGNIAYRGFKVRPYLDAGWGLLLVEYRGYGGNPGSPSEAGLYADGRAALDFLGKEGISPGRLVFYGESLGSGVAVALAAEMARKNMAIGALVLEAPFSSMADVAARHYPVFPVQWLIKDKFESIKSIKSVDVPVFMFHGTRDRIVPIEIARILLAEAENPKEYQWLEGAGHNNLYEFGASSAVMAFVERHWRSEKAENRQEQ